MSMMLNLDVCYTLAVKSGIAQKCLLAVRSTMHCAGHIHSQRLFREKELWEQNSGGLQDQQMGAEGPDIRQLKGDSKILS